MVHHDIIDCIGNLKRPFNQELYDLSTTLFSKGLWSTKTLLWRFFMTGLLTPHWRNWVGPDYPLATIRAMASQPGGPEPLTP